MTSASISLSFRHRERETRSESPGSGRIPGPARLDALLDSDARPGVCGVVILDGATPCDRRLPPWVNSAGPLDTCPVHRRCSSQRDGRAPTPPRVPVLPGTPDPHRWLVEASSTSASTATGAGTRTRAGRRRPWCCGCHRTWPGTSPVCSTTGRRSSRLLDRAPRRDERDLAGCSTTGQRVADSLPRRRVLIAERAQLIGYAYGGGWEAAPPSRVATAQPDAARSPTCSGGLARDVPRGRARFLVGAVASTRSNSSNRSDRLMPSASASLKTRSSDGEYARLLDPVDRLPVGTRLLGELLLGQAERFALGPDHGTEGQASPLD